MVDRESYLVWHPEEVVGVCVGFTTLEPLPEKLQEVSVRKDSSETSRKVIVIRIPKLELGLNSANQMENILVTDKVIYNSIQILSMPMVGLKNTAQNECYVNGIFAS